ncbi:hypothetical protein C4D60_Mb05t28770 [Musa balbisiana]|uniref:Uncharacterized protein n=1 Tax=Musa balbisiana TaxID=52838 RepID=A0A4S8JZJ7_MUSBA|nr:hypothetical protein C4D60_Mb05t28770 [Musa balbisiana]
MGNRARAAPLGSEVMPAARRPPPGTRSGTGAAKSSTSLSSAVPWWSRHPEAKRRRRVAGYKAYAVENKVRISLRRGLYWFKDLVHGR